MTVWLWLDDARPGPQAPSRPPAASMRSPAPGQQRRHPLRFVWRMDPDGRVEVGTTEFLTIMGPLTAALLRQPWSFIASAMRADADGEVARAIEARNTFSGLPVQWPIDGSDRRLPVEMSGLPVFDRERTFRGYRGFGTCRDIAGIDAVVAARCSPAAKIDVPALTPTERAAFDELGRELTRRINEAKENGS